MNLGKIIAKAIMEKKSSCTIMTAGINIYLSVIFSIIFRDMLTKNVVVSPKEK